MKLLHAAAECVPLASTGGLGDVLGALPGAQCAAGLDAALILPLYGWMRERAQPGDEVARVSAGAHDARIVQSQRRINGAPLYLCEIPALFERGGGDPYRDAQGREFSDNLERFAAFDAAVAQFCALPAFAPQVLHAHDWHTGLIPALLRRQGFAGASVFSVHNLAYQGYCDAAFLRASGVEEPDGAQVSGGGTSFMKTGILASDAVTTVSPGYAREIQTPAFGCGLEQALSARAGAGRLHGLINGIDEAAWNPATDAALARNYGAGDVVAGKQANRSALKRELRLDENDAPLIAFVGRLTDQKGADLIADAAPALLEMRAQIALVGVGDAWLHDRLAGLAARAPQRVAFRAAYDPLLVRRIMAGADALLMPSRFEPCGMTQLYAQRYGTLPIVRRTGGLADTVTDATDEALRDGTATGVIFNDADVGGITYGVRRALELLDDEQTLAQMRHAGMHRAFGWDLAVQSYAEVYAHHLARQACGDGDAKRARSIADGSPRRTSLPGL